MILDGGIILGGLALLILGAEALVRGSTRLASAMGMTPLLAGLLIASIGTSSPELTVSIGASFKGLGDLAVANVIGSNIANIALILGVCALIRPISINVQLVRVDVPAMILVTGIGIAVLWNGSVGRFEGVTLVFALVAYMTWTVRLAQREPRSAPPGLKPTLRPLIDGGLTLVGIGLLVGGGTLLVGSASDLARGLGISERVVGVTIVAVGTSLPELATSVVATVRRSLDVAVGNVVGSNIFNILGILGVASIISPIVAEGIGFLDVAMLAATAVVLLPLVRSGFSITRLEGGLLLAVYFLYVGMTIT